jgi:hypothetical protein
MKYIPLIISLSVILFFGCGYSEVKNQNLLRPAFEIQKTYYSDKSIFEFLPTYYIYSSNPDNFYDLNEKKAGTLFKITKKADFAYNAFVINDLKNKRNVVLKEIKNARPGDERKNYSVTENDVTLMTISQRMKFDMFKYDLTIDNVKYSLEGKINGYNNIVHSFVFNITDDNKTYAYIFREYNYFKNENEIIINRKEKAVGDILYVAACAFIEQILRENGYEYRS